VRRGAGRDRHRERLRHHRDGIYVEPIVESGEIIEPLRDRIVGRVALEDQRDYEGNVLVAVNQEITEELAAAIQAPASSASRSARC
jgi:hypothetical protein